MISQEYFQIYPAVHVHLKMDKKKDTMNFFFCIFFQSPHQVGMKNIVECPREYIAYFNALETTCAPWVVSPVKLFF